MINLKHGRWSVGCVCMVLGFMIAVQLRTTEDLKASLPYQRVEELSDRLVQAEKERDTLRAQLAEARTGLTVSDDELKLQAGYTALSGPGVIVRLDDSTATSKAGENPNLYLIHDEDLLRVVNELRAAGAEAISLNGQRLIGTSEIRCAGPTLSVNNVRSAAPFEVHAIGDKVSLANALTMRGGVVETLKVWGIKMEITSSDDVYVPPYKGTIKFEHAKRTEEKEEKGA